MISVWCSDGRKHKSDPHLKRRRRAAGSRLRNTPILNHYQLGNELGISGTCAGLSDGRLVPGYGQ